MLALFVSAFVVILFVLGREQLRPTLSDPKEVSRLLGAPILASVPYTGSRFSRKRTLGSAVESEAYRSLGASIQSVLPDDSSPKIILVTSAVHAEGKSTVTSRLGSTLALTGHKTLMISGDLRWPALHTMFDAPLRPGLTDLLTAAEQGQADADTLGSMLHSVPLTPVDGRSGAALDLLSSGSRSDEPSALLASGATRELFQELRKSDYHYVLVDGPPALGIADIQPLAGIVEHTLLVTRLDRVNAENVADAAELLRTVGGHPLGAVVIGVAMNPSPYYLAQAPFRGTVSSSSLVSPGRERPLNAGRERPRN